MSSSLQSLIKKLNGLISSSRRRRLSGDPAKGLEYNSINPNYRVSRKQFDVDIAGSPNVVADISVHVDVHGKARKANSFNSLINYRSMRVYGRGRGE